MKIILLRHGETERNKTDMLQDVIEGDLSAHGREQARVAGKLLRSENIKKVYCSSAVRTRQTLDELGLDPNIPVIYCDELIEVNVGTMGMTVTEFFKKYPQIFTDENFANEGGETLIDVRDRVKKIVDQFEDENILVVSHGLIISVIQSLIKKTPLIKSWQDNPRNCEIRILEK